MSDAPVWPRLSPAEARRIDQICDRFEAAWKAGPRPIPALSPSVILAVINSFSGPGDDGGHLGTLGCTQMSTMMTETGR